MREPGFRHHVDIGIDAAVVLRIGIADLEHHGVAAGPVDEMMAVGIARLEGRTFAGAQDLLSAIGDEGQLALQHHDELILMAVPVPLARPDARGNAGEIDPEGGEPGGASQAPPAIAETGRIEAWRIVAAALDGDRADIELLHDLRPPL